MLKYVFYSRFRGWNGTVPLRPQKVEVTSAKSAAWKTHTLSLLNSHTWTNTWLWRLRSRRFHLATSCPVAQSASAPHSSNIQPVHSFCLLGWESWLMTWQKSFMQIANICHGAASTPYIYLLILLNISAYYWLFVGGGQWCMFLHDAIQKKAISRSPHIRSCCFF